MSSENPDSFSLPENEIHFSPDADLDWWLNMLDLEIVFEPEEDGMSNIDGEQG